MSHDFLINTSQPKSLIYGELLIQAEALVNSESDKLANCCNLIAALKQAFGFWWVGIYYVKGNGLVLGPFQGPIACTRIGFGKGVCGTAWQRKEVVVVDDVDTFPGHIACSSLSKSEIVVPILRNKEVIAVLDIDSDKYADFDNTDTIYLSKLAHLFEQNV
ncbi:MAG: GAF domain-containing protein [Bacteroidetes bacterium]|nr:GAF domain-containing protein [Bacteroidota bacterium]